jgi:DNA-directed RNA polymerase specialized sigma24 family protein
MLIVVFREVGDFERRGPGTFRSWLRAILVHGIRDYFRNSQLRKTVTLPLVRVDEGHDFLRIVREKLTMQVTSWPQSESAP